MKLWRTGWLCAGLSALLLTACNVQSPKESSAQETTFAETTAVMTVTARMTTKPTTDTTETTTTMTTTTIAAGINPLTGTLGFSEAAQGHRPVAVMVNNVTASLPQYGIAAADIIYEMVVEAGITRLMAVYADYENVPSICSVRSCRYYYPLLANGMDAVYCHWGTDQTIAADTLKRLGIDRLDGGINGWQVCFFRDEARLAEYASEHTGYLDGSKLPDAFAKYGFRTTTDRGSAFSFRAPTACVATGEPCHEAVLHFSTPYWSTFTYDDASKTYLKQHNGAPHMDSAANVQLGFTNVFVLQTTVKQREDKYHMDIALDGGAGFYLSAGARQPITWKKTGDAEPLRFYAEDGSELLVNAGKSYIALIGSNQKLEWYE